jgi:hypothetical protein
MTPNSIEKNQLAGAIVSDMQRLMGTTDGYVLTSAKILRSKILLISAIKTDSDEMKLRLSTAFSAVSNKYDCLPKMGLCLDFEIDCLMPDGRWSKAATKRLRGYLAKSDVPEETIQAIVKMYESKKTSTKNA